MIDDPSEMSLVEILRARYDTGFDGWKLDEAELERYQRNGWDVYKDQHGNYFTNPHDYLRTIEVDGQDVGILVADEDDESIGVSHPHPETPHLIGLYVREPYRSQGIATTLVQDFMSSVEDGRCVVDCADAVKPFYDQLDCEVIYLDQFKSSPE